MGEVFLDTSAIFALLVGTDRQHEAARRAARALRDEGVELVTSSFVLLETVSLLQRRAGVEAVRDFVRGVEPAVQVVWIDQAVHRRAVSALLAASARQVSLTDWSSFEVMRDRGIRRAFAFDDHFRQHGFELVP